MLDLDVGECGWTMSPAPPQPLPSPLAPRRRIYPPRPTAFSPRKAILYPHCSLTSGCITLPAVQRLTALSLRQLYCRLKWTLDGRSYVCHHSCHFLCNSASYRSATNVSRFIWHSNQDSVVGGVATGWRITVSNPGRNTKILFSRHTGSHRVSYSMDTGIHSRGINGRGVYLTTHLHLLPMLRIRVAIPLLWGTAVAQVLRCCATNRKVAGSIPDGVIGNFL